MLWALLARNEDYRVLSGMPEKNLPKELRRLSAKLMANGTGTLQTCRTLRALSPFA